MRTGPRAVRADTRQQAEAFWTLTTFLLNGALFVLVGLELHAAVRGLARDDVARGLLSVAAVSAALVAVRFVFLFTVTYLIRLLDRRPSQRLRRVSHRARVVSGLAGFRGAVSLAAALAVPETVHGGGVPERDMIVFVTAGVIVATLLPGLLLPRVVRWARLPEDGAAQELHLAETVATTDALAAIPQLAATLGTDSDVVDRLRHEYERHRTVLDARGSDDEEFARRHDEQYAALRLAVLRGKRHTVISLRDQGQIDDTVLWQVQTRLDLEEVRLARRDVSA